MPTLRCCCSVISHESKVIVAGGIKRRNPLTVATTVEVLHINETNTYWSVVQNLPIATFSSVPLIIDKRLYIAAGYDEKSMSNHKVLTASLPDLLQNMQSNKRGQAWSSLPNMPYCSCSINHYHGNLITFSGEYLVQHTKGAWESVPYIHVYNPDTKSWDRVEEVVPHNFLLGMSAYLSENKILFIGGLTGSYEPFNLHNMVTTCWILTIIPKHPSIIPY